jgi:TPR repeat protein
MGKTVEETNEELMKRVEANVAGATCQLGYYYYQGDEGLQQDQEKAMDLWKHAAKLGSSEAHFSLGSVYCEGGELKKAKFHYEAAALPRYRVGIMEGKSGNEERALKHCILAASASNHQATRTLLNNFERGNN